jgi:hypothetical protein
MPLFYQSDADRRQRPKFDIGLAMARRRVIRAPVPIIRMWSREES